MNEVDRDSAPGSSGVHAARLRPLARALRSLVHRPALRRGPHVVVARAGEGSGGSLPAGYAPEPVRGAGNSHHAGDAPDAVSEATPASRQTGGGPGRDEKLRRVDEEAEEELREDDTVVARGRLAVRMHHGFHAGMRALSRSTRDEFTIFGLLVDDPDHNELYIPDVLLLPRQNCTSVSTDVSSDAMMEIMERAARARHDIPGAQLSVWLHHHGDMACFFSQTDVTTMTQRFPHADKVLSIVFNRRSQMLARLCLFRPVRLDIDIGCIRVGPSWMDEQALRDELAGKMHTNGGGGQNHG